MLLCHEHAALACAAGAMLASCDRAGPSQKQDVPLASRAAPAVSPADSAFSISLSTPTLGPPLALHTEGEQARARDYFMTLLGVETCDVEPHFQPASGRVKLGVKVVIEGRSKNEVPVNPLLGTLEDSEHRDYRPDMAGCTPSLPAARVTSGRQARGFITFEVPENASGLVMTYAPFVLGMGSEELKFSLGR